MPKPEDAEAVDQRFESIAWKLFLANRALMAAGMQPLSDEEIRQQYGEAVANARKAQAPPALGYARPPQPQQPVNPADFAEGGFVNDQSGAATALIRRQQGIR